MSEDWDFYSTSIDGHAAAVFVDLALLPAAPQPQRTCLLRVRYPLQMPGPDGLSDPAESEMLNAVEDELFAQVARALRARYVGRVTSQNHREHFYYAMSDEGFAPAVAHTQDLYAQYRFTAATQADPDWAFYKDHLFPGPIDLQAIRTRRQVDALIAAGDDVTLPRPIRHNAEFPTVADRDQFANQVQREGFDLTWPDDVDAPFPYPLQLVRSDRADLQFLDPLVTDLLIRVMDCRGRYLGWSLHL